MNAAAPVAATDRPHAPRLLTHRELIANDVHSYYSPKEQRDIRVIGIARVAQGLLFESDPNVVAYTERPRLLQVGNRSYELCFWYREKSGREHMRMVVLVNAQTPGSGTRRAHREAQALIDAAQAAYVPLEFVTEAELLAQGERVALAYRWLQDVTSAHAMPNRGHVETAVLNVFAQFGRQRLAQLLAAMPGYAEVDIQCVLASLLHDGRVWCDATDRIERGTAFGAVP